MSGINQQDAPSIVFNPQNRIIYCNSESWYQLLQPHALYEKTLHAMHENYRPDARPDPNSLLLQHYPIYYLQKYFLHIFFANKIQRNELFLYDGAMFCVSCGQTNGMTQEQKYLLRDLLRMAVKPMLVLEHVQELLTNEYLDTEVIYKRIFKLVQEFEEVCAFYGPKCYVENSFDSRCNVKNILFVGKEWAFTIQQFADMYAGRFDMPVADKFWGENYYDATSKTWHSEPIIASIDGDASALMDDFVSEEPVKTEQALKRSFCQFILQPLKNMYKFGLKSVPHALEILQQFSIGIPNEITKGTAGEKFVQTCVNLWLPLDTSVLNAAIAELPTITVAQAYRGNYICKPNSGLVPYIQTASTTGPLIAISSASFCASRYDFHNYKSVIRIFSGSVTEGVKYLVNDKYQAFDPWFKFFHSIHEYSVVIKAATIGCLLFSRSLPDYSTILDAALQQEAPFCKIVPKFAAVRALLQLKNPADLPKFVESCKKYAKMNAGVTYEALSTGEHAFEAITEVSLLDACKSVSEFAIPSEPVALYKETITASAKNMLTKSPNKHNRFYFEVSPLPEVFASDKQYTMEDVKELATLGLNLPKNASIVHIVGNNVFSIMDVDAGLFKEVSEFVQLAAAWACKEGALTESPIIGMHIHFSGMSFNSDAIHRGAGQTIPTVRRLIYGAELSAEPRLLEGIYIITLEYLEEVQLRMQ